MANYKQLFTDYMDSQGVRYDIKDDYLVKVVYGGDNLNTIPIYVVFDKDDDPIISVKCWDIAKFKNKEATALVVCNKLNSEYRWIKFYLDKDGDIVADCDAYIDHLTCGEECLNLVRRAVSIIDSAYPVIAKALFD